VNEPVRRLAIGQAQAGNLDPLGFEYAGIGGNRAGRCQQGGNDKFAPVEFYLCLQRQRLDSQGGFLLDSYFHASPFNGNVLWGMAGVILLDIVKFYDVMAELG
jgi:hypothetical protein